MAKKKTLVEKDLEFLNSPRAKGMTHFQILDELDRIGFQHYYEEHGLPDFLRKKLPPGRTTREP